MADEPQPSPARRRWIALLLWGVPVLVLGGAYVYWKVSQRYVSTDNAYVKADKTLVAAEVDGRVKRVAVLENAVVAAGDLLVELDDESLRYEVDRARAALLSAKTDVATLRAQYAQKQAELAMARRTATYTLRERERVRALAQRKLIAAASLDSADQAAQEATDRITVAQRDLATISARLQGRPAAPETQYSQVREAEAALERAELDLRHARIFAPRAGIVSHLPQVGDHLARGAAALAIVTTNTTWIEANLKETDLAQVRVGQPVRIRIDTYGRRDWRGHVVSISQATGAEFAILPAQNASGNWIKVVQRIPVRIAVDEHAGDPPLRAGMSAWVEVDTGGASDTQRAVAP